MISLVIIALGLHGLAMLLPALLRHQRAVNAAVNLVNSAALACGLTFSLGRLWNDQALEYRFQLPVAGEVLVAFDGLTLFFLFTFQLLSLAGSLFAVSYLSHAIERGLSVRGHLSFFTLLITSLQLLTVVHNSLVFLIIWECMAIGAFFSIVFEKDRSEVRRGGFWYFVATHASVLLLLVCFVVLREVSGSWSFGAGTHLAAGEPNLLALAMITGMVGFGIKAGFMPFHVWLPNAHPAAPSHVSGLLSAINIKAGIYGLARLLSILPPFDPAYGWALLGVSLVSAVLGVWYALAQHEMKRLLAYHSVENIGIIGLGLAVAWLGRCYAQPTLILMGFAGALLHTLNHAIFKGLLFFGAGSVALRTHSTEIELMGGLARVMPLTAICFLVGSISICGLPPFNGFVSEFLVYMGFLRGSELLGGYASLVLLGSVVGLAFMGGLALACFTKLYGIVFLGRNRQHREFEPRREPILSSVALMGLAALCAVLGIFPALGLRLAGPALRELGTAGETGLLAALDGFPQIFGLFLGMVLVLWGLKTAAQRLHGVRIRETWGCGYESASPRMQYTASGFAEELVKLGQPMLALAARWEPLQSFLPGERSFASHCDDRMEAGWLGLNQLLGRVLHSFRWIQSGKLRHYVLYVFAAVLFYLLCALVW